MRGALPREPRRPASDDPTTHLPVIASNGELGQETEEAAEQQEPDGLAIAHGNLEASASIVFGNSGAAGNRGPNKASADTWSGENSRDWTSFGFKRAMQELPARSGLSYVSCVFFGGATRLPLCDVCSEELALSQMC